MKHFKLSLCIAACFAVQSAFAQTASRAPRPLPSTSPSPTPSPTQTPSLRDTLYPRISGRAFVGLASSQAFNNPAPGFFDPNSGTYLGGAGGLRLETNHGNWVRLRVEGTLSGVSNNTSAPSQIVLDARASGTLLYGVQVQNVSIRTGGPNGDEVRGSAGLGFEIEAVKNILAFGLNVGGYANVIRRPNTGTGTRNLGGYGAANLVVKFWRIRDRLSFQYNVIATNSDSNEGLPELNYTPTGFRNHPMANLNSLLHSANLTNTLEFTILQSADRGMELGADLRTDVNILPDGVEFNAIIGIAGQAPGL